MKALGTKVENLEQKIDYRTPLKTQFAEAIAEYKEKISQLNDEIEVKSFKRSIRGLTLLTIVNTILLLVMIVLIGYSILSI